MVSRPRASAEATAGADIERAEPRICMPTWRNFTRKPFRCGFYEAQDILVDVDCVDLMPLHMGWAARFDEHWLRVPLYHDALGLLIWANPGLKKIRLDKEYELFVAVCDSYWDIAYVNAIERWSDRCQTSICWIGELWAAEIPGLKHWLRALSRFDYIFVGCEGSVAPLSEALKRTCYWLPAGVDTLAFNPLQTLQGRAIDVYSIGRRYKGIHRALLDEARRGELFYVYDTLASFATGELECPAQHRQLFANLVRRSRYFIVAPAKMNDRGATRGQTEVGHRYFEGAAAGAVMIGQAPDCQSYKELFPWPEAVIHIEPDGSDTRAVLKELEADPKRVAAIGLRNAKESLLHHDWVYRWKEMFRVAGIKPTPRMAARERQLAGIADLI